jgi:hypothetical protein
MGRRSLVLLLAFGILLPPASHAAVLMTESFEAPAMMVGPIEPQNGWTGNNGVNQVTNALARTGTQSAQTSHLARKSLSGPFQVHAEPFWYMDAWGYLASPSGQDYGASFSAGSPLGTAFYLYVNTSGEVWLNTGTQQSIRQLGAAAVRDKWLLFRIEKVAPLTLRLSLQGPGVNESFTAGFAVPWDPIFVSLEGPGTPSGGPYWDDVFVATDDVIPAATATWGRIKSLYR